MNERGPSAKSSKDDQSITTDRLRHQIDSGQTGDKVDHPDPAAAPLGTDEEAGGVHPVVLPDDQDRAFSPPPEPKSSTGRLAPLFVIIVFVTLGFTAALFAVLNP